MSLTEKLRQDLQAVIEQAEAGNTAEAVRTARKALHELNGERLLTLTEAAEALGVRSTTIVRLWSQSGFLSSVRRGNQSLIPLAEIERVQDDQRVQAIRVADRLHDASSEFGTDEGLTDDEMEQLSASRPGRLPWQTQQGR